MIEELPSSSASVDGVLDVLSSTSRLLSAGTGHAMALPAICRLLVPGWVDGCAIGLVEAGAIRPVCKVGAAELDSARSLLGLARPTLTPVEPSGWILDLPIVARGQSLGVFRLAGRGREPGPVALPLASEIALRIAIAIETEQALAREHLVADTLQRALLPDRLPRYGEGLFRRSLPSGASEAIVGGDWYDAFELPDGRVAVSIGDVAGHGLSAAVIMSEVRQAVRAASLSAATPSQVLDRANQMLTMRSTPTMVTALFGMYDPPTSTFTYASAGHPAPLLGTPDGRVQLLPSGGLPLGVVSEIETVDWTFSLLPGYLLVLYTDGMIEYSHDIMQGEETLRAAIAEELAAPSGSPAKALQDRIFAAAQNIDDAATLTLSVLSHPLEEFNFTFSAIASAVPIVRRALERYALENGLNEDLSFSLVSAVGEALANAVEHAYSGGAGIVRLEVRFEGDTLRAQVEDSGRWRPATNGGDRGRGIPLMRALMDGVEIHTGRASTQVKMRLKVG